MVRSAHQGTDEDNENASDLDVGPHGVSSIGVHQHRNMKILVESEIRDAQQQQLLSNPKTYQQT